MRNESPPLVLVPVTQAKAKQFIWKHHRHNVPSITAVFCVGLSNGSESLAGVAMCGQPKARMLMDGRTLEVTRVAVDGTKNANSMLYGACARAAKALGYLRLVTYTLPEETGASLRAAGWQRDAETVGGNVENWRRRHGRKGTKDLFGREVIPDGPKVRWWKSLDGRAPRN
jgi:hypothetical protein